MLFRSELGTESSLNVPMETICGTLQVAIELWRPPKASVRGKLLFVGMETYPADCVEYGPARELHQANHKEFFVQDQL